MKRHGEILEEEEDIMKKQRNDQVLDDEFLNDEFLRDPVLDDQVLQGQVFNDQVLHDQVLEDQVLEDPVLEDDTVDITNPKNPVVEDVTNPKDPVVEDITNPKNPVVENITNPNDKNSRPKTPLEILETLSRGQLSTICCLYKIYKKSDVDRSSQIKRIKDFVEKHPEVLDEDT